jgi:hypothetical protein
MRQVLLFSLLIIFFAEDSAAITSAKIARSKNPIKLLADLLTSAFLKLVFRSTQDLQFCD